METWIHYGGDISIYSSMPYSYILCEERSKSFFVHIQAYSDSNARGI